LHFEGPGGLILTTVSNIESLEDPSMFENVVK